VAGLAAAVTALLLGVGGAATTPGAAERPPRLRAEAALLVDLVSGEVLFSKNAEIPLAPASLTKLMTIYLALEDVAAGRVRLEDEVSVSVQAARTPSSRVPLRAGERVPLGKLLEAMAVICEVGGASGANPPARFKFASSSCIQAWARGISENFTRSATSAPDASSMRMASGLPDSAAR